MTYNRIPDRGPGLRLHLNENTAGCSPAVLDAIRGLSREDMAFYPDYAPITAECERWFGVAAGWVQLTNGLDEGLQVVAQYARLRGDAESRGSVPGERGPIPSAFDAIILEPAFEMYAACTEAAGGAVVRIPPAPGFEFPLEPVLSAISTRTRLIYLTDPNNPTGLAIPAGVVERIAAAAPRAIVLVDEAYADFSRRTVIGPALDRLRNLVVGRTFAKAHGLAALRVGALIAHPGTLAPFRRMLTPYSLNICAIRGLSAALQDRAYLDWYVAQSDQSLQLIYGFCERHGLQYWPSHANFVLVRIGDAASTITEALAARGLFVRDRSNQPGCEGCIRVTAGIVEHTEICLKTMEDILASGNY